MVLVGMGKQHSIQALDPLTQHLVTEIRPRIDHQVAPPGRHQNGRAKPLVAPIGRPAYRATTRYDRHALGSACAQKCNRQIESFVCLILAKKCACLSLSLPASTLASRMSSNSACIFASNE